MSVKFCSISSGSSGNCIFVGNQNTKILIDAGLSGINIKNGLENIGVDISMIDALFITHEHSDHILGAGILSRKYNLPIFATEETWQTIENRNMIGNVKPYNKKFIYKEENYILNDIIIKPFSISHDAVDPVGYNIFLKNKKISIATDLGCVTDSVKENLYDSDILLIESNHDIEMLKNGSYPWPLKKRVLSEYGHLSNVDCGNLLVEIMSDKLKHIYLGHLSSENNVPIIAYNTVKEILEKSKIILNKDLNLSVALRGIESKPLFIG